mgnify:CR=1 FL=1
MRTVKEISGLTGISVRTLHYYDEIGLLKPTQKSDAGYRLYDDRALEILQQILFFREFDIPLKEIKAVLENPALERNQILQMQRLTTSPIFPTAPITGNAGLRLKHSVPSFGDLLQKRHWIRSTSSFQSNTYRLSSRLFVIS